MELRQHLLRRSFSVGRVCQWFSLIFTFTPDTFPWFFMSFQYSILFLYIYSRFDIFSWISYYKRDGMQTLLITGTKNIHYPLSGLLPMELLEVKSSWALGSVSTVPCANLLPKSVTWMIFSLTVGVKNKSLILFANIAVSFGPHCKFRQRSI